MSSSVCLFSLALLFLHRYPRSMIPKIYMSEKLSTLTRAWTKGKVFSRRWITSVYYHQLYESV